MKAGFQQDARTVGLITVLGQAVLNLLRFGGDEHLNGLFDVLLEISAVGGPATCLHSESTR